MSDRTSKAELCLDNGESFEVELANLTQGGCVVLTNRKLAFGERMTLRVKNEIVEAQVLYCFPQRGAVLGIRASADSRAKLAQFGQQILVLEGTLPPVEPDILMEEATPLEMPAFDLESTPFGQMGSEGPLAVNAIVDDLGLSGDLDVNETDGGLPPLDPLSIVRSELSQTASQPSAPVVAPATPAAPVRPQSSSRPGMPAARPPSTVGPPARAPSTARPGMPAPRQGSTSGLPAPRQGSTSGLPAPRQGSTSGLPAPSVRPGMPPPTGSNPSLPVASEAGSSAKAKAPAPVDLPSFDLPLNLDANTDVGLQSDDPMLVAARELADGASPPSIDIDELPPIEEAVEVNTERNDISGDAPMLIIPPIYTPPISAEMAAVQAAEAEETAKEPELPPAPAAPPPDPINLPALGSDGVTVSFESTTDFKTMFDRNLKHGGLVVESGPLPLGTQRMLSLVVPGHTPYAVSARVMFHEGRQLGFMLDSFALHKVRLQTMAAT